MQANDFPNAPGDCVARYDEGVGARWWRVSLFRDGSVRVSTLGCLRVSPSVEAALFYWRRYSSPPGEEAARAGIIGKLEELACVPFAS